MLMDPPKVILPVYASFGERANVGCGFVAKSMDGTLWLLTVAHMASCSDERPNIDFEHWSSELRLVCHTRGALAVKLFLSPTQLNCRLIFRDSVEVTGGIERGPIDDILAIKFPLPIFQMAGFFEDLSAVDLTSEFPPIQTPSDVCAYGYPTPDFSLGKKWPERHPVIARAFSDHSGS